MQRSALVLAVGLGLSWVPRLGAQTPSDTTRTVQDSALRVFFDCPGFTDGCDFDFLRTEMTYVDWVRNREDADVHVLVTTQTTGGGGTEYSLAFIGLRRFRNQADTLRAFSGPSDTQDEKRRTVVRTLKLGLVRFLAATPLGARLEITYAAPSGTSAARPVRDPWNYWVFAIDVNGNLQGEKRQRFLFSFGSLSANRVTERWKLISSVSANYNESTFLDVPVYDTLFNQIGTRTVKSVSRGYNVDQLISRAAGVHWSVGARASMSTSTYGNYDLVLRLSPGVEYDYYPYAQSTRRLLTVRYTIGPRYFDYTDTTIFNKTKETLFEQSLNGSLDVTERWGSVFLSLTGSTYLHDFHKTGLEVFGSISYRIFRGLSVRMSGNYERIHNQLNLSRAGASDTEILLRRRELATGYRYFTFFTLSYNFGSTHNNVVNPRFGRDRSFFF